ncbi:MAG: homoserine dehydrogenase [Oscillospiraceae bacterium]|jgi:homoserine dehydrogenase|nr:homoserine dehydrogenase [Oscillospiraceae bacterium]
MESVKKIAILGYGIVGSGVAELFYTNRKQIEKKAGTALDLKYILDIRDFSDSPYKEKFTKSIDDIVNDDEVVAVAECMGGVEPAFTFIMKCLEKGKSVATSNKELVAFKGDILLKTAKNNNCNFFFEASVGGAIPIIRPLHKCLAANRITQITGILNGTTNYILTKMETSGLTFEDALKEAQQLGYAERDPSADILGDDACRKICILSSLVFGKQVYPQYVYTKGIREITLEDISEAKEKGYKIKLIANVKEINEKITVSVSPTLVSTENMLSQVSDVFNAVMIYGNGMDKVMFYGRGAGKLPTASAVLGDIIGSISSDGTVISQYWESSENSDFIESFDLNNYTTLKLKSGKELIILN